MIINIRTSKLNSITNMEGNMGDKSIKKREKKKKKADKKTATPAAIITTVVKPNT